MSGFIPTGRTVVSRVMQGERGEYDLWGTWMIRPLVDWFLVFDPFTYTGPYYGWPRGGFMNSRADGFSDLMMGRPFDWADEVINITGHYTHIYRITGIVLDSKGAPVSGTTVKLYRTSDDAMVAVTTSKETGEYSFGVDNMTTQYYVVGYRPAPAISDTSINTLVGAV